MALSVDATLATLVDSFVSISVVVAPLGINTVPSTVNVPSICVLANIAVLPVGTVTVSPA